MARQHVRGGSAQPQGFAAGRGMLLVLFAVAIGVLLLAKAVEPNDTVRASASPKTTTSAEAGGGDTPSTSSVETTTTAAAVSTIPPAHAPGDVAVIVANGRNVQGAAAANKDALLAKGFNALAPTDHPATQKTIVYFADVNWQADAVAVGQALNITTTPEAFPASFPIAINNAKVVVILGTDGQGLKPS